MPSVHVRKGNDFVVLRTGHVLSSFPLILSLNDNQVSKSIAGLVLDIASCFFTNARFPEGRTCPRSIKTALRPDKRKFCKNRLVCTWVSFLKPGECPQAGKTSLQSSCFELCASSRYSVSTMNPQMPAVISVFLFSLRGIHPGVFNMCFASDCPGINLRHLG